MPELIASAKDSFLPPEVRLSKNLDGKALIYSSSREKVSEEGEIKIRVVSNALKQSIAIIELLTFPKMRRSKFRVVDQ